MTRLVAISVDSEQDPVLRFRERLGLGFTLLLDADQRVARRYQTFRFPETLLIGRDGVILERYVGPRSGTRPSTWIASAVFWRKRATAKAEPTAWRAGDGGG